jgi:hypothetical protein
MATLGVLVVHGMGDQRPTFADGLIAELDGLLKKAGVNSNAIAWQRGYWADVLNAREADLWDDMSRDNDLDLSKVRKFVLNALGDAVAYRQTDGIAGGVYDRIHDKMHGHLAALAAQLDHEQCPVIVLAHSLGAVIMSDYIWNEQRRNALARGRSPIERMESLCGIVTFGCNIPLFTLAFRKEDVKAITFPAPNLPEPVALEAQWLNYYDPDDVLGWPLKPLSTSYNAAVTQDIGINVGNIFTSWSPMSHGEYWTDNSFTHPVAKLIERLARASATTRPAVRAPRAAPTPTGRRPARKPR